MGKMLAARMTIPLDDDERRNGHPIIFYEWLPETISDALVLVTDGMTCRYWADQECVQLVASSRKVEGRQHNLEVWVGKLQVLVEGVTVEDEVADVFIQLSSETQFDPSHFASAYDAGLLRQHQELTERIHRNVLFGYNRVIGHVRAERGQYWLEERKMEGRDIHSDFVQFRARVSIDGSEWMRLTDTRSGVFRSWWCPESRRVGSGEWKTIGQLMERRPDTVGALLTAADDYRSQDQSRTAVIEAVSALEIAVGNFTDRSRSVDWFYRSSERFGVANLKAHRRHLGFTATVSYLFPLLFTEEQMSAGTLRDCREAIEERNNIVHNGQRAVKPDKMIRYLESIRRLCEFLRSHSPKAETGEG
ncbi:hypothetical protein VT84_34590 [Gemmata sp. SH-PL17]|uniref:hypothetical protein n=1 Tax=Gemmata sp. SH-PL17 TaxID=1630693 RepID=UPI00078E4437|nr:hypothetical protein [Gemmata sp. SH-PL17]AMV29575.1 hypothetical protein VT84_34590 [Gemmata sp. SH-PL17]